MATRVETPYTQRARYYSSLDGFNIQKPAIPAHVFVAERDRAFDARHPHRASSPATSRGRSRSASAATAPFVLARYARIRAGERLTTRFAASGALYYVIAGSGETVQGADAIAWDEGDAFCLPGGGEAVHVAGAGRLPALRRHQRAAAGLRAAGAAPARPRAHRGRALSRRRDPAPARPDPPARRHHRDARQVD